MSYSRRHYERLSNGRPDTAADVAERTAHRAAADQANAEMMARFAPLTADNAQEAVAWQQARIREILAGHAKR